MDPGGMMNEAGTFNNLAEIWPFPINGGGVTGHSSLRTVVSFTGTNLVHQFADSNLISSNTCGDPARISHVLSQAVAAGIAGSRKRRNAVDAKAVSDGDDVVRFASRRFKNDGNCDSKKQKISEFVDQVCDGKAKTGSLDQKKQLPEPPRDYIHVRARRGQATDSHSLAERARREKISERMKILQELVPGCNKVIGKALVLDEIINYIQSLQRQVEFLSMKLEAVNSRMNPEIQFNPQQFENHGMQFSSQATRGYNRGASPQEWLHMQVGGGFERT